MRSDPDAPAGRRFVVHGRVQGVGFRWWTRDRATELGLTGTVRNQPDGTVEVHAFGSPGAVDRLAHELTVGPPSSQVDRIDASPLDPKQDPARDFRILA